MKKLLIMTVLTVTMLTFAACGSKKAEETEAPATTEVTENSEEAAPETEEAPAAEVTEEEVQAKNDAADATANVDPAVVSAFADQVKKAFADKDMEGLAALVSFPTYVGIEDGIECDTKEAFLEIAPEKIFTDAAVKDITDYDTSKLESSMAGYVIGSTSTVIFSANAEGALGITGINIK